MKILLAKRRALGDTVFLSSTLENLAQALPGVELSVLVPDAFAPVLEGHPRLTRIFTYEEGWLALLPALRSQRFDYFVQLHSSPGSRWLASLSGARHVSYSVQNNEVEKAYGKHPNALEWDGFFLRTLFGEKVAVQGPQPRIHLEEAELVQGRDFWSRLGVDPGKVVFLGLGASRLTKRWLPAHFARFSELLRDRTGLVPAIITGPGEVEALFGGEVVNHLRAKGMRSFGSGGKGDFVHAAGLGVRDLACALSAVRAYVGNDSGPKHMAAAVGIPTFTFFGPEDPGEWHPYSREQHPVFFREGLSCRAQDNGRWCALEVCTVERHRCMADLDPLEAFEAISKQLAV